MQIARFEEKTSVEGPGIRTCIWLQGCSIGCADCCNPQMQNPLAGTPMTENDIVAQVVMANADGLTLMGGEPLDQIDELVSMLQRLAKVYDRGIILFTGYTWEQLQANSQAKVAVALCDLVIAGPFMAAQASQKRRWIGSDNQTIHFVSERYLDYKNSWPENKREIEIILRDGAIMINGTPLNSDHELSRMFANELEG